MKVFLPSSLRVIAWAHVVFPVGYLLFVAIAFDVPLSSVGELLLSPGYYLVALASVVVGFGILEMRRWSLYAYFIANFMIAYETAYVAVALSESHNTILAYGVCLVGHAAIMVHVFRSLRVPYLYPKIQWWESNPRYQLSVPVQVKQSDSGSSKNVKGKILDIGMKGCFIQLDVEVTHGSAVGLAFEVFGQTIECKGVVAWKTLATVTHPRGIGVKFERLQRHQKRRLRMAEQRLKRVLALYRRSRGKRENDDLLMRLDSLQEESVQGSTSVEV